MARVRWHEPMSAHTSWRAGGPADMFFLPRDVEDLAAFLRALPADGAGVLGRSRQQSAGARRRHSRRGDRHCRRLHPHRAPFAEPHLLPGERAVRAHRARLRALGPGAGGVLRRHSRNLWWRAGDECRRLRRRDLAARAAASKPSTAAASGARAQPQEFRSAIATSSRSSRAAQAAARGVVPVRGIAIRAAARGEPRNTVRSLTERRRRPSRSGAGAAARCSRIRPAIMPRA